MTKKKIHKSEAAAVVHDTAAGLFRLGIIDRKTMREFDEECLTPIEEFSPQEIKALREKEEVSQTIFAYYLGVTKDSISQWERGIRKPVGAALKLLSLVKHKGLAAIA